MLPFCGDLGSNEALLLKGMGIPFPLLVTHCLGSVTAEPPAREMLEEGEAKRPSVRGEAEGRMGRKGSDQRSEKGVRRGWQRRSGKDSVRGRSGLEKQNYKFSGQNKCNRMIILFTFISIDIFKSNMELITSCLQGVFSTKVTKKI